MDGVKNMYQMHRKRRVVGKEFDDYVSPRVSVLLDDKDTPKRDWKLLLKVHLGPYVMPTVQYTAHFMIVMIVLFAGAFLMALIEDPDHSSDEVCFRNMSDPKNFNESMFWDHLTVKYNLSLDNLSHNEMLLDLKSFLDLEAERESKAEYDEFHSDRRNVFLKWFYFAVVTSTTIGYGDVSPKTDLGKIAALVFFVISIAVMMTLLNRTGVVCTSANKKLFGLVNKYVFKGNNTIASEELMAMMSMFLIFISFLLLGIWYANNVQQMGWKSLDIVYFWIVTFTTVGLGDMSYPLEKEVKHVYEHVVYRVFGLALLAGIIDSIVAYMQYRKDADMKKQMEKLENEV